MTRIDALLTTATAQLVASSSSPRMDAEILLAHTLQVNRAYLYAHAEAIVTTPTAHDFETLLQARVHGMPIAYLLGSREFWSIDLAVNADTLIPRAETELLVEVTLGQLPAESRAAVLDLGTGSGAVAIALASSRPQWNLHAIDVSAAALQIAQTNAATHRLHNLHFYQSDWFNALPVQPFDAIVSNPPYLSAHDPHLLTGDLRYEPKTALVSGVDGLDAIRRLVQDSPTYLRSGAWLLIEHGNTQAEHVQSLMNARGFHAVRTWHDLQGHPRVTGGTYTHTDPIEYLKEMT